MYPFKKCFTKSKKQGENRMKKAFNKNYLALGALIGATASQAAVTFDSATKTFAGEIDMATYYSGVEIAVGVIGVTLAVGLFFSILRKARS
jgi:hypothetical protein